MRFAYVIMGLFLGSLAIHLGGEVIFHIYAKPAELDLSTHFTASATMPTPIPAQNIFGADFDEVCVSKHPQRFHGDGKTFWQNRIIEKHPSSLNYWIFVLKDGKVVHMAASPSMGTRPHTDHICFGNNTQLHHSPAAQRNTPATVYFRGDER